ncbi:MAG: OFA family MFS transporter [Hydrotalea sp.]|nr:OFA family MFS transporter [Hydrotalea sp.]
MKLFLHHFFSRNAIIARPGYNRWLVPPCALAVHLSIGMAYGFSVFWLPLSRAVGIDHVEACPSGTSLWQEIFLTDCDWRVSTLGWIFTLFFLFLGFSAAVLGRWVERVGPRNTGFVAALCWAGGLLISALGVELHQAWLMWLGAGALGGIGLGLGYISPVSTLMKWFPDRRGMASGLAIMGFGGGAMIGSPLANLLIGHFASATSVGVAQTLVVLAVVYYIYMTVGAFFYRVPADDWRPKNFQVKQDGDKKMISRHDIHVEDAFRTKQFWLMWLVLFCNVAAGIGLIGMASPMLQEIFAGQLLGVAKDFNDLSGDEKKQIATIAAGFTGLISLFNIIGRFAWSSASDKIGRKATYSIYFILGFVLYACLPSASHFQLLWGFVLAVGVIVSMYGGGFSTIPAYLSDIFGTKMVGAIHGRLLTAWAMAGIFGPVIVNYMREYQLHLGFSSAESYNQTMYILAGFLVVGLVANLFIYPVAMSVVQSSLKKFTMLDKVANAAKKLGKEIIVEAKGLMGSAGGGATDIVALQKRDKWQSAGHAATLAVAWGLVLLPLAWGFYQTMVAAVKIFG